MVTGEGNAALEQQIGSLTWYHTLELRPGLVTPGWFDTRAIAAALPFPDLAGKRCLDVGTFDGFWAFEMERRGAGEVIAVDILDPYRWDWPAGSDPATIEEMAQRQPGRGFELAKEALGSRVERRKRSVYELDPGDLGRFDFVYVGSLLLHLRDPVGALERVRSVCAGELLLVDAIDLELTLAHPRRAVAGLDGVGRPWWWSPNAAGLVRMVEAAGFELTEKPRRLFMKPGAGQPLQRPKPKALLSRFGRLHAVTVWRGDPHLAVRARVAAAAG